MKNRQTTLLWMKDLLEHMAECHERLQWASGSSTESFLTESLLVDLIQCQRLCAELRGQAEAGLPLAASV